MLVQRTVAEADKEKKLSKKKSREIEKGTNDRCCLS